MDAYKHKILSAFKILDIYGWMVNSYVLDVFVCDLMNKLPQCWRSSLRDIDIVELGAFLAGEQTNRMFALSTLALRACLKYINLSRVPEHALIQNIPLQPNESEYSYLTHPKLKNLFCKHVKQKKRHEIMKMAEECFKTCIELKCEYLIDFGSGVGHLARVLAYGYNINVLCLEAQSELINQAKKLDKEMEITASKHLSKSFMDSRNGSPRYLNMTLDNNIDTEEFLKNIKLLFNLNKNTVKFGIIGLHPCGDLIPIMLQLFALLPEIKFVKAVGCCYMKLSTFDRKSPEKAHGYPLSAFLKSIPHELSYSAREVACHAIETYCQRLKKGLYSDLQVHSYRAALEELVIKYWPHLKHSGMRSIKHSNQLSFKTYCEVATSRLGIAIPDEDINSESTLKNLSEWKDVVRFYSLRLLLAPLVETIILLDRLIFLEELGTISDIIPVFDPILSPRNQILTAIKP
ncbi:protein RRNAD1-like isoform X1 [Ctenocephalides felis]|uniref:protein RRNAD1-like isoform X1 n=1 Tax=Ctenocephalides felis TaxID=7515 RepID=UPI000E6E2031|nr:protein RRNAD1-like isoform X1 [Ctenocephalides felis]